MLEIPENILEIFFKELNIKGKYTVKIENNQAHIIPRLEERYYKPIITIKDINYFRVLLMEYVTAINEFNIKHQTMLKDYQDLSYIFNILLFNLTASDCDDLSIFLEKRISFLQDDHFNDYENSTYIFSHENTTFTAKREIEEFGLETPFIMLFQMNVNGNNYDLPLIRYAIDDKGVCYIYAVQIGRGRVCQNQNPEYKNVVNKVNQGIKENRDISPSFVLVFAMFLKMLKSQNINKIMIPIFLFNRYRKYYKANTVIKSNAILERMIHNITTLVNRADCQIEGFNVKAYPLDIDDYYHIDIMDLRSENQMIKKLLKDDANGIN